MDPRISTIDQDWKSFLSHTFPGPIPREQHRVMCDCFYAGYFAMQCVIKRIGEPDISEEQAMAILTEIDAEMGRFHAELLARAEAEIRSN